MSKGNKRSDAIHAIALLIALAAAGCGVGGGKTPALAPKPEAEAAAPVPRQFGDAVLTPAIGLEGWTTLIAYQRDAHGNSEVEEAAATILRAGAPGIEHLEESERILGGERQVAEFRSSRILSDYVFSRKSGGEVEDAYLRLREEGGAFLVEGGRGGRRYDLTPEGGLRIERTVGGSDLVEEYRPDGSSRLSRDGLVLAEGGTRVTEFGFEYFEREPGDVDGNSELFYSLKPVGPDRILSGVGSVEPLARVLVEGLSSIRGGESPLRDIAILDCLMGSERRITPLLALAYLGKLPSGGK